jgi:tetratricopeptide (TPR) repeat protein
MATWQDQILEHYIAMAQPGTRLMRMSRRAEAAHINQNLSLARQYYEQAAQYAISWATTSPAWVRMMTLQGLVDVLILQKDIDALYTYVGQFLPLIQGNSYSLHKLGRIMMRIGDRAAARHYFACALDLNDGEFHTHHGNSLLYRDWAQVEKSEGHYQKTDALYQLAIIEALYAVEHALGWDSPRWNEEGWELVEHLKREWSALAAQYIDLIPPDKPSQPS